MHDPAAAVARCGDPARYALSTIRSSADLLCARFLCWQNLSFWMEVERYKDMAQGDPRNSEAPPPDRPPAPEKQSKVLIGSCGGAWPISVRWEWQLRWGRCTLRKWWRGRISSPRFAAAALHAHPLARTSGMARGGGGCSPASDRTLPPGAGDLRPTPRRSVPLLNLHRCTPIRTRTPRPSPFQALVSFTVVDFFANLENIPVFCVFCETRGESRTRRKVKKRFKIFKMVNSFSFLYGTFFPKARAF